MDSYLILVKVMGIRNDLNRYFVLALKQIELRGYVYAESHSDAMQKARDLWYIHDDKDNTIRSGTANTAYTMPPFISETDKSIRILHVEDIESDKKVKKVKCPVCNAKPGNNCIKKATGQGRMSGFHFERIMKVSKVDDKIKKIIKGTRWD